MTALTALEISALTALGNEGLDCNGSSAFLDLLDDNMSCMFPKELAKALGISLQAVGGVMSSLQQKGLTSWDEIADGKDGYWLTDDGIRALADLPGNEIEEITTEETTKEEGNQTMFNLTITSTAGLRYEAIVAAASAADAIKEGRAAVKLAGINRSVGRIDYRAKKA